MKQNKKLLERKETFLDLRKVIKVKIFNLSKEINEYNKELDSISKSVYNINKILTFLKKESTFFDVFFRKKSPKISALIFLQINDNSFAGKYSDKKITEYISKIDSVNTRTIFIVGKRLYEHLLGTTKIEIKTKAKIKLLSEYPKNFNQKKIYFNIFKKISNVSLHLFEDLKINSSTLFYSDIRDATKLFKMKILPLDLSNIIKSHGKSEEELNKIFENENAIKINKIFDMLTSKKTNVKFASDLVEVNKIILKMAITVTISYSIINFLLNMAIRKMHTLQESDENILKKMDDIDLEMRQFRKEYITREMLGISAMLKNKARKKTISNQEHYFENNHKKEGQEDV